MNNDLIKRNIAIAYATSGLIRRIEGEDWIRVSEVVQSLKDVPTVGPLYTITSNTFAEGASARPQGEWKWIAKSTNIQLEPDCIMCSNCKFMFNNATPYCPNCGSDMRGAK